MEKSRVQGIVNKIEQYRTELNNMDVDVKLYLDDKNRYSYPQHEQLVEEIYKFEEEIHKIINSDIQFRLDGLMHSLMIHKRIWERWFDEDALKTKKTVADQERIVNLAYKTSKSIWAQQGVTPTESRSSLAERLRFDYAAAKNIVKATQKIIFAYDTHEHKIKIKIKDRAESE